MSIIDLASWLGPYNRANHKAGNNIARPMRQQHDPRQDQSCAMLHTTLRCFAETVLAAKAPNVHAFGRCIAQQRHVTSLRPVAL